MCQFKVLTKSIQYMKCVKRSIRQFWLRKLIKTWKNGLLFIVELLTGNTFRLQQDISVTFRLWINNVSLIELNVLFITGIKQQTVIPENLETHGVIICSLLRFLCADRKLKPEPRSEVSLIGRGLLLTAVSAGKHTDASPAAEERPLISCTRSKHDGASHAASLRQRLRFVNC